METPIKSGEDDEIMEESTISLPMDSPLLGPEGSQMWAANSLFNSSTDSFGNMSIASSMSRKSNSFWRMAFLGVAFVNRICHNQTVKLRRLRSEQRWSVLAMVVRVRMRMREKLLRRTEDDSNPSDAGRGPPAGRRLSERPPVCGGRSLDVGFEQTNSKWSSARAAIIDRRLTKSPQPRGRSQTLSYASYSAEQECTLPEVNEVSAFAGANSYKGSFGGGRAFKTMQVASGFNPDQIPDGRDNPAFEPDDPELPQTRPLSRCSSVASVSITRQLAFGERPRSHNSVSVAVVAQWGHPSFLGKLATTLLALIFLVVALYFWAKHAELDNKYHADMAAKAPGDFPSLANNTRLGRLI